MSDLNGLLPKTHELLAQDFELAEPEDALDEDTLLRLLTERVAWMIDHQLEQLLSLMYRMDINEAEVHAALSPLSPIPPHLGLATLILERQKRRVYTKLHIHVPKIDDQDEDWSF
jgi:hypothetical protein